MYLANTSRYQQEGLSLENQLSIAKYIKEYLTDPQKSSDLIPANTGISDNSVESQIKEYNDVLLKRDKLVVGSSSKNPIVIDLNNSLSAMKQTIIRSVDNLIVGLNIQLKNIREQEEQTTKRIEAVPAQQKYVLTVERQQKIKEELYLYLLNKREENALTQAITESNARILNSVVRINLQITFNGNFKSESAMNSEGIKHMIKKAYSRGDFNISAVKIQFNFNLCFLCVSFNYSVSHNQSAFLIEQSVQSVLRIFFSCIFFSRVWCNIVHSALFQIVKKFGRRIDYTAVFKAAHSNIFFNSVYNNSHILSFRIAGFTTGIALLFKFFYRFICCLFILR